MSTLPTLQVIVLQLVADNPTLANNDPKYSTMINATIICVAIHSALSLSGNIKIELWILSNFERRISNFFFVNFSGGMYNPMLATVLFGGCKGHEWTDHVLIYWIGSTFGALVASYIYPTIQKRIYSDEEKKMKWITNFVQLNFLSLGFQNNQWYDKIMI